MNTESTVFVVDDDEQIRDMLRTLIESIAIPVETYTSAEQFLNAYDPNRMGCLLLDVRMPGMSGIRLLEYLHTKGPHLPVILLTGHGDIPMTVRAMQNGAFDFFEKPFNNQQLLERIQDALTQDRSKHWKRLERAKLAERLAILTDREREILDRIVAGQANKLIAIELEISERTVEMHRKHLMDKLEAGSLAELMRLILDYRGSEQQAT